MREGQDEIFGECVEQSKGEFIVVVVTIDWVFADIVEGVVHPPHVPLHAKTEAAKIDWARDHRPGGRLFGHYDNARVVFVSDLIELTQKGDRLQVFITTMDVG